MCASHSLTYAGLNFSSVFIGLRPARTLDYEEHLEANPFVMARPSLSCICLLSHRNPSLRSVLWFLTARAAQVWSWKPGLLPLLPAQLRTDHGTAAFPLSRCGENFLCCSLAGVAQWTERQTVNQRDRFPGRAHGWVAGKVPSRGCVRDNHTLLFLSLFFSFPSPLCKNK